MRRHEAQARAHPRKYSTADHRTRSLSGVYDPAIAGTVVSSILSGRLSSSHSAAAHDDDAATHLLAVDRLATAASSLSAELAATESGALSRTLYT